METIWKGKQTNKQTSRGGMCRGTDAGGSAELCSMQSPVHNTSEYTEELRRCIRDVLEKCRVQYAGLYSDTLAHCLSIMETTRRGSVTLSSPRYEQGLLGLADIRSATRSTRIPLSDMGVMKLLF